MNRVSRYFVSALVALSMAIGASASMTACMMGDESQKTSTTAGVDEDGDNHDSKDSGGDDCNDKDATIHPGAPEICGDNIDQDCNGSDLACECTTGQNVSCDTCKLNANYTDGTKSCQPNGSWSTCTGCKNKDADGDGHPSNEFPGGTDCNDANASVHPGATDVCGDGVDQDCSGTDAVCVNNDKDGDGYTSTSVNGGTDCNDNNAAVHPGATETCGDGIDQDCSGSDLACVSTGDCTAGTTVGCNNECAAGTTNGTKTCQSNKTWGACTCTPISTGPVACANLPGIADWVTITLVAKTTETSKAKFWGMCDNGSVWSDFTVIPGCEAVSRSGDTFTCTTQVPRGWTFEGNNNLNNGYWSTGVLTDSEAQAHCPSSYNSTTRTCADPWSVTSAHGTYFINGVECKTSVNWVVNAENNGFNCRVAIN